MFKVVMALIGFVMLIAGLARRNWELTCDFAFLACMFCIGFGWIYGWLTLGKMYMKTIVVDLSEDISERDAWMVANGILFGMIMIGVYVFQALLG